MGRSSASLLRSASFATISLLAHAGAVSLLAPLHGPDPFSTPPSGGAPPAGETFEVESPRVGMAPRVSGAAARDPAEDGPIRPPSRVGPAGSLRSTSAARTPLFGAAGVAYATDLPSTFTRAFPQAASADPGWASSPVGGAGWATVTLLLDETGHIVRQTVEGAPAPALRRGIALTLALMGARTFTSEERVTRLRLSARVSADDIHDGLHGEVFALSGGSFSSNVGSAFFALPGESGGRGRRVDVELRQLR
jgi:hypothetical protein